MRHARNQNKGIKDRGVTYTLLSWAHSPGAGGNRRYIQGDASGVRYGGIVDRTAWAWIRLLQRVVIEPLGGLVM